MEKKNLKSYKNDPLLHYKMNHDRSNHEIGNICGSFEEYMLGCLIFQKKEHLLPKHQK